VVVLVTLPPFAPSAGIVKMNDVVIAKRIEEGIQVKDKPEAIRFMHLAEELKLGIADRNNISLTEFNV
jgi:hypothetical protein